MNNVTRDCDTIMATGKLLLLMTTAINEKPRKHCRSLNERIKIARNLLNCYFELIKSEGKKKLPYMEKNFGGLLKNLQFDNPTNTCKYSETIEDLLSDPP